MVKRARYISGYQSVESPCTITTWTPAPVTEDAANLEESASYTLPVPDVVKHGAALNLGYDALNGRQSFTNRPVASSTPLPYQDSQNVGKDLPISFAAGEEGTITATRFLENGPADGRPCVDARHVLTVHSAANAPVDGDFRPAPATLSKAPPKNISDMIDLSTLPTYSFPGMPSALTLVSELRWDQGVEQGNGVQYRRVMPNYHVRSTWKVWGPARTIADAALFLLSDRPVSEKEQVAIPIAQNAIDLNARLDRIIATGDLDWGGVNGASGIGGVNSGSEKMALLIGGILFNDSAMIANGQLKRFSEDGNTKYITQSTIDNGVAEPGNTDEGSRFAQYIDADVGMPEWTQANNLYQGLLNAGNRYYNDPYRLPHFYCRTAQSLAIQLWPALYNAYNSDTRDPFLEYADRIMERDFYKLGDADISGNNVYQAARTTSGDNFVAPWVINAWDTHRAASGQTAVWDWPA